MGEGAGCIMTAWPSLRERTRGRWFGILTAVGVHARYLANKHGPCPICGGKDRFRWDNKNGDGTFYCNQCGGGGAGSGVDLVMRFRGLPFPEAAVLIEQIIGDYRPEPVRAERSPAVSRAALNMLWQHSRPIRRDDAVERWLRSRAIALDVYPSVLRCAQHVQHVSAAGISTHHPAMLAMVTTPDGKPGTIHKTYLSTGGGKAAVDQARKFASGSIPAGGAVRLAAHNATLGVAEGIETAFAAMQLFGTPCWAALNAGTLEKFQPPPTVKHIIIYADNDLSQVGQQAASALAARLSTTIKADVTIPNQADTDWNDVLMKGSK
jgi:putative DNA primase/helicase